MAKFRKKPVVVEAWHIVPGCDHDLPFGLCRNNDDSGFLINTLEGQMTYHWGDWIIRGVAGELYPCKDEIFQATYEPAE